MAFSPALQKMTHARFLIIGSGNERWGDDAAGPQVAGSVADWQLPSVKAISTPRLTTELVNDMATAHYVIFVDAFSDRRRSRTAQLCPLVLNSPPPYQSARQVPEETLRETLEETPGDHPLALLSLTELTYGHSPQAWWLRVPTESFGEKRELSKTTERGCDHALTTIAQFLKTYQQPVEVDRSISAQPRQPKDCQRKGVSSKALPLVPQKVA